MARPQPETPLAKLVNARMSELGTSRAELARRMVFGNEAKGLRRFDSFLATGQDPSQLLMSLPQVLGLDGRLMEEAAIATRQQISDAEDAAARERFRPYILALTKWVRSPFFIQVVAWYQKVMPLPNEIARLSSSKQVREVAGLVRRHFREHQGRLGAWGTITGYRLQLTYDHAVLLNVDGTVREGFNRRPEPPAPEIRIGGKRIPVGLFVGN